MNKIVQVCIPNAGKDHYDYLIDAREVLIGTRVKVTLRHKKCFGIIVGVAEQSVFHGRLKPIVSQVDTQPLLDEKLLAFYRWMSRYYHASLASVLHFALPKQVRQGQALEPTLRHNTHAQGLDVPPELNPAQQTAVQTILPALASYRCFLLHGVTGSGKTEVYLRVIDAVLSRGRQVLVLVPEIGLTPQLIARFQARFVVQIAVVHSHLTLTQRYQSWCAGALGEARIVLGTRSALFTPLPQLGLIVVDEEHDASFKEHHRVCYSARDCALMRAKLLDLPVILGSATPSLETYRHAMAARYTYLPLANKALSLLPLHYEMIDLHHYPAKEGLTTKTIQKITQHLNQGNQVLVFVNRRGYAPILLCHDCGWMADCAACERHFTVHQKKNRMICHHCGEQQNIPTHCPQCQSQALLCIGTGTQRLFQALTKLFPAIRSERIDQDACKTKQHLETLLTQIESGHIQLMVGTQLLAKGHHFPRLTLVVVVDADAGLYHQDFRSLERLGQLILQVSGRAGRADLPGEVLIQTHFPTHPLLLLLIKEGYDAFAQALLMQRQQAGLPPYLHMSLIRAQGRDLEKVEAFLMQFKQYFNETVSVYGPAPALMFKKAGQYQMQLCLLSMQRATLQQALHQALQHMTAVRAVGVKWRVDVDPIDS